MWDYPRPPSLEQTGRHVVVELGGVVIADTRRAWRVCETSHPPVYYVPRDDIVDGVLRPSAGGSFCEWKGPATYWTVEAGGVAEPDAAGPTRRRPARSRRWPAPSSFYPARMDRCLVDGEVVRPQAGGFYGGWITDEVVGPFKGEPGTLHW